MHKIRFFPDTITVLQIKREEADTMILKEKERTTIQDLQTQEKSCIEKYGRYAQQAKDPELTNLWIVYFAEKFRSVTVTTVTAGTISRKLLILQ